MSVQIDLLHIRFASYHIHCANVNIEQHLTPLKNNLCIIVHESLSPTDLHFRYQNSKGGTRAGAKTGRVPVDSHGNLLAGTTGSTLQ